MSILSRPRHRLHSHRFLDSLKHSETHSTQGAGLSPLRREIDSYFVNFDASALFAPGPRYNTHQFYKSYSLQFPILTKIAQSILIVTATSVPAESLFSITGIIQDEQRNSLQPACLEQISIVKNNL